MAATSGPTTDHPVGRISEIRAKWGWFVALGIAMLIGRLLPIALVLGLAGSLARQAVRPDDAGTLPTYRPQFVAMLVGVVVLVAALTYLPALALGPLAEGLI